MSGLLNKKDWKEAAAQMLRQIQASRLDIASLFPGNEHLTGKSSPTPFIRDNLQKFFSKPVESLVQIAPLGDLLKQTPQEVIQDNDKTYRELKKLQQEILYELMQAKGFLDSKEKTYSRTKLILSKLFGCGVGFPEAEKLKAILDDNRALEVELSKKHMTLDQLDEAEAKLKRDQTNIDPAFAQIISDKRSKFEKLNNQLMQLLSKNSLRCEELKRICDIIEQAEHIKFRLSHFTNVCHIRDSFHWTIVMDQFLDGGDHSRERFKQLTDRIKHVDTSRNVDFDNLKSKLSRLAENLGKSGDIDFFKVLLEPVNSIDSTDQNIQTLIDFLKTSWWTLLAKKKLESNSITVEELEELYKSAPPGHRGNLEGTYQRVRELYQHYKLRDNQLVILLKELRDFTQAVDEEMIQSPGSVEAITGFNSRFEEVKAAYETKLSLVASLKGTERYLSCLGLVATLNCALLLSQGSTVDPQQLDNVDFIFGSEDEARFSSIDLVARVFAGLNDKKIVTEFLNIVDQQPDNVSLDEKIDINTARKYIEIMKADRQIIDYVLESERVDDYVARFEEWEARAQEFVNTYQIDLIQEHYEEFKTQALERFLQERTALMEDFKWLRFYSDNAKLLQAVSICVETLDFMDGKKRDKAHWVDLLERSREVEELIPAIVERIQTEVQLAEHLIALAKQTTQETPFYQVFRDLQTGIPQSCVDLSAELGPYADKLRLAEEIEQKIAVVLEPSVDRKLPLVELERIVEEVRFSFINFDIVAKQVSSTVQICRAFLSTVKAMKKEPRDIKIARALYSNIPLSSRGFELMLEQLDQEEEAIEEVEALLAKQLGPAEFDLITFIEHELSKVQYYDVSRTRLNLFKQKVTILEKVSLATEPVSLSISLHTLKGLKAECTEALRKYDNDEELELLNIFLGESEVEVNSYLMSLENIKTITTFDKVTRVLLNFVDVSPELLELQNKLRPNKTGAVRLISFSTNQKLNGQAASMNTVGSMLGGPKRPELNPANELDPNSAGAAARMLENSSILELQTLRCNTLNSIRGELQKNATVGEAESECINISHNIERQLFLKSHFDGSYPGKATKLLRLFQALLKLRRITLLVVSKNYNIDLLLFLMEQSLATLQEMDSSKQKMLKILTGSAQLMAAYHALMQSNRGEELMSSLSHPRKKYGDGLLPLQQVALDKLKATTGNPVDTDTSSKSDQKRLLEPIITEKSESAEEVMGQEQEKPETERIIPEQDDYKISKIGVRKDPSPVQKERIEGAGDEKKQATGQSESGAPEVAKKKGGAGESSQLNHKGVSDAEVQPVRLTARKRDSESDGERDGKDGLRVPAPGGPLRFQPAWSVYKGHISMEIKGHSPVDLDYSDLVCIDEASKIRCFPKVQEPLKLRGMLDSPALEALLNKTISKPATLADNLFLLGSLETRSSVDILNKLVTSKGTGPRGEAIVFYCKVSSGVRLYLFPRRVLKPEWHVPFGIPSRRIYRSKADYFWLMMQTNSERGSIAEYIDPHPVYSPHLFTSELPPEFLPPSVGENSDPEVRCIRANATAGSTWAMGTGYDAHLPASTTVMISASRYNLPGTQDPGSLDQHRTPGSSGQGRNSQSVIGGNMLLSVLKPAGDQMPQQGTVPRAEQSNQRTSLTLQNQNSTFPPGSYAQSQSATGFVRPPGQHPSMQGTSQLSRSAAQASQNARGMVAPPSASWQIPVPPPADNTMASLRKGTPQPSAGRSEFSVYAGRKAQPAQVKGQNHSQTQNVMPQNNFLGKRPNANPQRNPFMGQIHEVDISDEGGDFFDQLDSVKPTNPHQKSSQKFSNSQKPQPGSSHKKQGSMSGINSLLNGGQADNGYSANRRPGGL